MSTIPPLPLGYSRAERVVRLCFTGRRTRLTAGSPAKPLDDHRLVCRPIQTKEDVTRALMLF